MLEAIIPALKHRIASDMRFTPPAGASALFAEAMRSSTNCFMEAGTTSAPTPASDLARLSVVVNWRGDGKLKKLSKRMSWEGQA